MVNLFLLWPALNGELSALLRSLVAKDTDEVIKPTSPGKYPLSCEKHFLEAPDFLDPYKMAFIVSIRYMVATSPWV